MPEITNEKEKLTEDTAHPENTENSEAELINEQGPAKTADAPADEEGSADEENESFGEDFSSLAKEDLAALKSHFRELSGVDSIFEIDNLERYGELRELGLTPKEAYLATRKRKESYDNRGHLSSSVPKGSSGPRISMTSRELDAARELFSTLSDAELQSLYKRVSR